MEVLSMELEKLSAIQLGELVNTKKISPIEVIKYFIDRIERRNPSINAFTYTKFDEALEEAKKLETRILAGEDVGLFAGVPVGLKDFLPSKKGWTNSHGGVKSLICEDVADSEFWKAANKLGAIAIGKTNAPAFGFSGACQNKLYGATRNPFDTSRTSGGSSGGSAAAVADGLLGLAEGGDAGGSIRIPSGWCNLFGYKSSLGTVPSICRPDAWTATHPYCFNGALTRTVEDSAAIMSKMARYDPRDPISLPINANKNFVELMNKSVKGKKIAFTFDFNLFAVDPEIKDIVFDAAMKLTDAGIKVDVVNFNWKHSLDFMSHIWCWSISVDTALDMVQWKQEGLDLVRDHRDELPQEFIEFNDIASNIDIFDFRVFNEVRTDILDNFETIFERYDYIISPTAICKPLPISNRGRCIEVAGKILNPSYNFIQFAETFLVNFVGYPAASVPAGFTSDNCPVGMQVIGKQYHDEDVFALARTFEQIQPWSYDKAFNRM